MKEVSDVHQLDEPRPPNEKSHVRPRLPHALSLTRRHVATFDPVFVKSADVRMFRTDEDGREETFSAPPPAPPPNQSSGKSCMHRPPDVHTNLPHQ